MLVRICYKSMFLTQSQTWFVTLCCKLFQITVVYMPLISDCKRCPTRSGRFIHKIYKTMDRLGDNFCSQKIHLIEKYQSCISQILRCTGTSSLTHHSQDLSFPIDIVSNLSLLNKLGTNLGQQWFYMFWCPERSNFTSHQFVD